MKEILRCTICGGKLEFKDKLNGILACRNCGNEIISSFTIKQEKEIPILDVPKVMESVSQEELAKKNKAQAVFKAQKKMNVFLALSAVVAVVGVFGIILFSFFNQSIVIPLKNQLISMALMWVFAIFIGLILKINVKLKSFNIIICVLGFAILASVVWLVLDMFIFPSVS